MTHSRDGGPSGQFAPIVKDDATPIGSPRAIYVGTGGDLAVRMAGDTVDTVFKNVPSGHVLPICPNYVRVASTAADLVALF